LRGLKRQHVPLAEQPQTRRANFALTSSGSLLITMTRNEHDVERLPRKAVRRRLWPVLAICVGALLPWSRAPRSGIMGLGKYALLLAAAGIILYALTTTRRLDLRWWPIISVPLAFGCLALAVAALTGYGALGAIVTAVAAVAWMAVARRAPATASK
jgi:hypothetical protein